MTSPRSPVNEIQPPSNHTRRIGSPSHMNLRLFTAIGLFMAAVALTGCVSSHFVERPEDLFAASPQVSALSTQKFESRTAPGHIEFYYFWWNPLTKPNAVQNWQEIFVLGPSSSPAWRYEKVADVVLSKRRKDDVEAKAELQALASRMGGDAVIDLRRDPMIDAPKFGSRIIGYRYLGTVVRQDR